MTSLEAWIAVLSALVTIMMAILGYLATEVRRVANSQSGMAIDIGQVKQALRNQPFNIDFGDSK